MIALSRTASASSGGDVEKLVELVDVERAGQAPRGLGRADVDAPGCWRTMRSRTQVVEEAAHRRQAALHAARAQAAGVRPRREHAHVLAVDLAPVREIAALHEIGERAQVARVVRGGVRREAPLGAEMPEVAVEVQLRTTSEIGVEATPSVNRFTAVRERP